MRGEHRRSSRPPVTGRRIIPACAGNTGTRVCQLVIMPGSSPHARGTPLTARKPTASARDHPRMRGEHVLVQQQRNALVGIIPACAGNTASAFEYLWRWPGSSPHARGTLDNNVWEPGAYGDHPRMRGEHTYLPAIPIPDVAVLYHFIQSDGPCASCLHRSSLTSWLHSSSHLRNRSASPSKPNHRNPWASSWIDEHEMQHAAHYWPNRPLSPCHH